MSLFALIAALLLEQLHPLSSRKYLHGWLSGYVDFFQQHFNAGQHKHGKIAWLLAVLPLVLGVALLSWLLYHAHPVFAWAFNVLVLYLTMGFRRFSHYFTDIHHALRDGKLDEARGLLAKWRGIPSHELNAEEVARVTIEEALIASHRNVFGVIVWFVLFSVGGLGGAAGALLYRLGQFLRKRWGGEDDTVWRDIPLAERLPHARSRSRSSAPVMYRGSEEDEAELREFGGFARQVFYLLEWLPVRMTALTFAIVGDFEDTVYCWRTQAASWPDSETGILLASGAGALGVRLGMAIPQGGLPFDRAELGVGDEADADFMRSTIGLVWRSVVFWLILLLLLTLASLLG
ncbi:MAG: cobalamin biosynthesis protein [Gallionella sp.]|nr:cobalamin biosynthesis protein [Gallionella sp.]